jgi:hypothetical protein
VRLEQAVVRKLRESPDSQPIPRRQETDFTRDNGSAQPDLAVVMRPSHTRSRISIVPWIRRRYGIEQVQQIALSWLEWDALVTGEMDSPHLRRVKERLTLAQFSQAESIVVIGEMSNVPSDQERMHARHQLERVVRNMRSEARRRLNRSRDQIIARAKKFRQKPQTKRYINWLDRVQALLGDAPPVDETPKAHA